MGNKPAQPDQVRIPREWLQPEFIMRCFSLAELKVSMNLLALTPDTEFTCGQEKITLLHCSAKVPRVQFIQYFVNELHVDPNIEYNGKTPLITAIQSHAQGPFHFLINHPLVNVEYITTTGLSALAEAARPGCEQMFEALLGLGIETRVFELLKRQANISPSSQLKLHMVLVVRKRLLMLWLRERTRCHLSRTPLPILKECLHFM